LQKDDKLGIVVALGAPLIEDVQKGRLARCGVSAELRRSHDDLDTEAPRDGGDTFVVGRDNNLVHAPGFERMTDRVSQKRRASNRQQVLPRYALRPASGRNDDKHTSAQVAATARSTASHMTWQMVM
jgi:hypothetical protein